jgi:hypothetical protein
MDIIAFVPGVDNYRGFCVAAITGGMQGTIWTDDAIKALPQQVRYDEYVAVVGIMQTARDDFTKRSQIMATFGK